MIPPSNGNNLDIDIITKIKLLLSYKSNNPVEHWRHVGKILSILESVFSSPATGKALSYFCQHGAATAWILQVHLDMPQGTAYRALKKLRALGLIEEHIILSHKRGSSGGPRTRMYALKGADAMEVAKAIRTHNRALSPKYRHAEKLIQSPLIVSRMDLLNEVKRTDLLAVAREQLKPSMIVDTVYIAMELLREQGVKVLR